jgi:hypothetical protein
MLQSFIMNSQDIVVFNPFEHDIIPTEFDSFGGDYENKAIKIWAVVSGASQGGWSGHKLYTQQSIDVKSWKPGGDTKVHRSDLVVFRSVEKSHNFFKDIPKFAIVELDVFINDKMNRAVMVGGRIITKPTKEMIEEQIYVQTPKTLNVEGFEGFEFNHEMQNFSKKIIWLNKEIIVSIDVKDQSEITDELETLNKLLNNQEKYNQIVIDYGVANILALKNESWLGPNERPMTKTTFIRNASLESIRIYKEDGFEFGFDEERDIFNGGYFIINGTTEKGADSYDVGF